MDNRFERFKKMAQEEFGITIKQSDADEPLTFESLFANKNKLTIPFGNHKIIAEIIDCSSPEFPPELVVYLCNENDVIIQDICVVRSHYEYKQTLHDLEFTIDNDFIDCLVYGDSDYEDYTNKFVIGIHKDEEEN